MSNISSQPFNGATIPSDVELVNLADYSHPKLLDTSTPPSFDSPEEVERYFAKVEMNCLFLNILMTFKLNIDDDADTERADRLLSAVILCECRMSQMLHDLFRHGKISEDTLFDTKEHLHDLLLEHPDLIVWYTDLADQFTKEKRELCMPGQEENMDIFFDFLLGTGAELDQKLRKILLDKLSGNSDPANTPS